MQLVNCLEKSGWVHVLRGAGLVCTRVGRVPGPGCAERVTLDCVLMRMYVCEKAWSEIQVDIAVFTVSGVF